MILNVAGEKEALEEQLRAGKKLRRRVDRADSVEGSETDDSNRAYDTWMITQEVSTIPSDVSSWDRYLWKRYLSPRAGNHIHA